ncbi:hypothetical protein ACWGPW_28950, partial [Paenibacillus chitinolyticus]
HILDTKGKLVTSLESPFPPYFYPDGRFSLPSLDKKKLCFYSATGTLIWEYAYGGTSTIERIERVDQDTYLNYSGTWVKVDINGTFIGKEYAPSYVMYRPASQIYDYKLEPSGSNVMVTRYTKAGAKVDTRTITGLTMDSLLLFYDSCILSVKKDGYGATTIKGLNNALDTIYEFSGWPSFLGVMDKRLVLYEHTRNSSFYDDLKYYDGATGALLTSAKGTGDVDTRLVGVLSDGTILGSQQFTVQGVEKLKAQKFAAQLTVQA